MIMASIRSNGFDRTGTLTVLLAAAAFFANDNQASSQVTTTVVVRVDPIDLHGREFDERPAEIELGEGGPITLDGLRFDLTSFEVRAWDLATKKVIGPELPTRWYDGSIPDEFAVCDQNASGTDGISFQTVSQRRWGEFVPVIGDGRRGHLAWMHRQNGNLASHYQISFQRGGRESVRSPIRGFIGDGSPRCAPLGDSTTGMIHSRLSVADWNQDGLFDLILGASTGNLFWYPNQGTKTEPKFPAARLIVTSAGKPLDIGYGSAPLVVDWDNDDRLDILCGAERNRILYFRNEGSADQPKLVSRGFLKVDGQPIALPVEPVPNSPVGVYTLDYYPVLEAVDWNGDGKRDLLAGGYITGRVFYYENVGTLPDGTVQLADRGPLLADGQPLNVIDWAAAPSVADFDGDGDLDLVSGNMAVSQSGGDDLRPETFLVYFENVGTRTDPKLSRRNFPRKGNFPRDTLGTPRAVDFNGDGLTDLAVSANMNIYLFPNVGTSTQPLFDVATPRLPSEWGYSPLPTWGLQFLDYDGDGRRDFLSMFSIYLQKQPGKYVREELLEANSSIDHPAPYGDSWTFTQLADLNGDGKLDLLFGTHEGHVWLHVADREKAGRFDLAGVKLQLANGDPIHVGPKSGQDVKNFTILQGSRTTMTVADFDADGLLDMVVGETDGLSYYFRNVGTKTKPVFEKAHDFESLGIRMVSFAVDWNRDSHIDVVGSAANGKVVVWKNQGGGKFAKGEPLSFPAVPYGPSVSVADWNDDGDDDLIIGTAYGYFCWFERSFLDRGMAKAVPVGR